MAYCQDNEFLQKELPNCGDIGTLSLEYFQDNQADNLIKIMETSASSIIDDKKELKSDDGKRLDDLHTKMFRNAILNLLNNYIRKEIEWYKNDNRSDRGDSDWWGDDSDDDNGEN